MKDAKAKAVMYESRVRCAARSLAVCCALALLAGACRGRARSEQFEPARAPASGATDLSPNVAPAPSSTAPGAPADGGGSDASALRAHEWTAGIVDHRPANTAATLLQSVRAAWHQEFDRVVFEFAGDELPGYHVEYIDKPVRKCGSGDTTELAGDGWLQITFEPANAHTPEGKPTVRAREQKPNLPIVRELELTCDFEAQVTWVLGVSSPNKYRVLRLKSPTRLVLDVRH